MKFLKIVSLDEAKSKILDEHYLLRPNVERVHVAASLNRYAAETLTASHFMPPFNRSTVDGYAVFTQEVMGASESIPAMLSLGEEIRMGQYSDRPLLQGEAIYVPTGAMIPDGANGVAMIEYTEKLDETTLLVQKPLAFGENIIYKGDDARPGDMLISSGHRIRGLDMGMLAGSGIGELNVFTPLRVALFSTGDEIIDCQQKAQAGEIYDINGYALLGALQELGCEIIQMNIIKDDFDLLFNALKSGLAAADLVILSGGSSMGTRDFTQAAIEAFEGGEMLFHGISLKPGKPTMVGAVGQRLIFGLPGHPTASALVFHELVKPYILQGYQAKQETRTLQAELSENLHASPGKDNFIPVKLYREQDRWLAKPILGKSGIFSIMATASGYLHITSEREGLLAGDIVSIKLL